MIWLKAVDPFKKTKILLCTSDLYQKILSSVLRAENQVFFIER